MPPPDPTERHAGAAPAAVAPPDAPADFPPELRALEARYALLGELGRGGMAVVYRARERGPGGAPGREVAVKVVSRRYAGDLEAVRRFEREARTVAGLSHPNIVRTIAIEQLGDDAAAIVSQYVPGQTLREALRAAAAPLDFGTAAAVLRDLAAALAHAHAHRVVHRDVKPENVFLERGTGRALLADFGIARRLDVDSPLTVDGSALGTPTYMAPEQIVGRPVDERTDVYALGLVGWEMLAGRRPWQGETLYAVLHKQQHEELPDLALLRPDIPAYLLAAVRGAVAKDPAARWRDGAELLRRLTPAPVLLPALPNAAGGGAAHTADHTMRVPPAPSAGVAPADDPGPAAESAAKPAAAPAAWRTAWRPRRASGPVVDARRWAAVAVALAVLAGATSLVLRSADDAEQRAADAAVTGVSDAQLDSLLRAAARAAPLPNAPAARSPAPRSRAAGGAAAPAAGQSARAGRAAAGAAAGPERRAPSTPRPARGGAAPTVAAGAPAARPAAPPAAAPAAIPAATPPATPAAGTAAPTSVRVSFDAAAADARCASPRSDDQRACLLAAVDRGDAGLTREYQALIAELRRRAGGAREPAAVEALRAEQRAWIDARDRQCRAALAGREGALWGVARAPCFATLSERRAGELRARLGRLVRADSAPASGAG